MKKDVKRKKVKTKTADFIAKSDERPCGEESVGAASLNEESGKVLRLRLDGTDGIKKGSSLASAQDDGALGCELPDSSANAGTKADTTYRTNRTYGTAGEGTAARRAEADDGHRPPLQKGTVDPRGSGLTLSEAGKERWRKIRAGELPRPGKASAAKKNPLFDLPEEKRGKLFAWLRECPYDDAVLHMLADDGLPGITRPQLGEFFAIEAEEHWEKRLGRAAAEANALVRLAEKSPVRFSAGILAALGQEAFRQIASGQVEPVAMGRLATLFLKARSDERTDQMQELKREKLTRDLQGQIDHALEKLAEEVDGHPEAREAFEALRTELARSLEEES